MYGGWGGISVTVRFSGSIGVLEMFARTLFGFLYRSVSYIVDSI
ncbi:unnamed protein product [Onchocerca flexuosa]|uniref:Bestrophin homolog n=1 Tax=Onchocerca flexuosa TaxID=387005 RepID=A0A183HLH7_9BILA|nr:unnamed protein product [Onchocerca flexuosa]